MNPSKPFRQQVVDKWRELTVTWLGLAATLLLSKFGDAVFDSATSVIGKTLLLQVAALLLISSVYLGWRVHAHGKEKPEVEKLLFGIEFRKGPRTGYTWMPFCPQCHVVLHPKWDDFQPVRCLAGCGWQSTISPHELCEILNKSNA